MLEDESIHRIPAATRRLMLENMVNSPAFALFTDRWNEVVLEALEKRIFDVATDDAETHVLKRVRQELTGTHHPRKIVETLIRTTQPAQPAANK